MDANSTGLRGLLDVVKSNRLMSTGVIGFLLLMAVMAGGWGGGAARDAPAVSSVVPAFRKGIFFIEHRHGGAVASFLFCFFLCLSDKTYNNNACN
mgnify:CR=1 FL=1